jgi:hypothetical protein
MYNHIFGKNSIDYWMPKHQIMLHLFTRSNWKAWGKVMKEIMFGKRRWLVCRKEWIHDKCSLCFKPNKMVTHINFCRDPMEVFLGCIRSHIEQGKNGSIDHNSDSLAA